MLWRRRGLAAAAIAHVLLSLTSIPAPAKEVAVTVSVETRLARTGGDLLMLCALAIVSLATAALLLWIGRTHASS